MKNRLRFSGVMSRLTRLNAVLEQLYNFHWMQWLHSWRKKNWKFFLVWHDLYGSSKHRVKLPIALRDTSWRFLEHQKIKFAFQANQLSHCKNEQRTSRERKWSCWIDLFVLIFVTEQILLSRFHFINEF